MHGESSLLQGVLAQGTHGSAEAQFGVAFVLEGLRRERDGVDQAAVRQFIFFVVLLFKLHPARMSRMGVLMPSEAILSLLV